MEKEFKNVKQGLEEIQSDIERLRADMVSNAVRLGVLDHLVLAKSEQLDILIVKYMLEKNKKPTE
ncbi:Spo0E family sporulation regulatory protein-aspartic acid phosphatase [Paenibacillus sp. GCM10012307]|uniref:Spo0E family sporulation regulatory protein-aspartic acid phosphatase n=1 Tax=Paenibacillus roseus TaxID=2798579 RepID=A0A934MP70_9BACL|nr:aspartyl-phosphate phosphatase Spo0E family protein [Paenibacillus roseus]MBJ6361766.1 Spo0E family sporulation regulatory protein-aspartic acid phosphatase [Paenibacillus roseus]